MNDTHIIPYLVSCVYYVEKYSIFYYYTIFLKVVRTLL